MRKKKKNNTKMIRSPLPAYNEKLKGVLASGNETKKEEIVEVKFHMHISRLMKEKDSNNCF